MNSYRYVTGILTWRRMILFQPSNLGSIESILTGALDKYNIIPNFPTFSKKSWDYYTIRQALNFKASECDHPPQLTLNHLPECDL